jgi:cytidylate kinase
VEIEHLFGSTRDSSPLRMADDAVQVDTTDRPIDEIVDFVVALAHERLAEA